MISKPAKLNSWMVLRRKVTFHIFTICSTLIRYFLHEKSLCIITEDKTDLKRKITRIC
jgi:hypothetical protein